MNAPPAIPAAATRSLGQEDHCKEFLETAVSLGAKVCRDALWADGRCNWLGNAMEPLASGWKQVYRAFGPDLYSGTSGIALYLARLYSASEERLFRKTSLGAVRHALKQAGDIEPEARIGFYSGWVGIAYAALEISDILGEEALRRPALKLLGELGPSVLETQHLDVLAGCAGAIPPLLRIQREQGGPRSLTRLATDLGDRLIDIAAKSNAGWSWGGTNGGEASGGLGNLTGFSHGAGGIGWALLELYEASGETRFREAGEAAFRYERHWFDAGRKNWPDLRDPAMSGAAASDGPSFMRAWCHGAPGIGLSRLRAYQILGCPECRSEAEAAIATTCDALQPGPEMSQNNFSLCHGLGGNCDLLIYGAAVLERPEWLARAQQEGLRGLRLYEGQKLPWPCGTQGYYEVPGLMLGLSGIGYFCLRLLDPAGTPPILIVVPRASDSAQ